ncbi:hypothetical protein AU077_09350 [Streptococcus gallolyticus]|nr:hypothetical protein AU077_06745 [Streptococcus gallolyticus]ALT81657.1 hypothetical protein AU077_09350 [Streptococcus gallolyticus]
MYWHKAKINIENVMILVALTYLLGLAWQGFFYIELQGNFRLWFIHGLFLISKNGTNYIVSYLTNSIATKLNANDDTP